MTAKRTQKLFYWRFRFLCPECQAEIQPNEVRPDAEFVCKTCGAAIRANRRFGWARWAGVVLAIIVARFSPIENVPELFVLCLLLVFAFAVGVPFVLALILQPCLELRSLDKAKTSNSNERK